MQLPSTEARIASQSVGLFLSRLAAPTATPGGGAVVALAGAMSASLIAMAAGITKRSKLRVDVAPEMAEVERRAHLLIEDLLTLADADVASYDAVMRASSLPTASDHEETARATAIDAALRDATLVQLRVAEACVNTLELAEAVAEHCIRQARGDVAVAALGVHSALRGALLNIEINASGIHDIAFSAWCHERQVSLLSEGERRFDIAINAAERIA